MKFILLLLRRLAEAMTYVDHLKWEVKCLQQANADLRTQSRKQWQIIEALGDYNRYCASLKKPRSANEKEAIDHYFGNGGPVDFARRFEFQRAIRRHIRRIRVESRDKIAA